MKLSRQNNIVDNMGNLVTPKEARNIVQTVVLDTVKEAYKAEESEAIISFESTVGDSEDITLADLMEIAKGK